MRRSALTIRLDTELVKLLDRLCKQTGRRDMQRAYQRPHTPHETLAGSGAYSMNEERAGLLV